jgi:hypothetical protein
MTDERSSEATPNRDAYFGDLHVHTAYSLDAFLVGAANNPDAAYEFGKGEAKPLMLGGPMMRLTAPLDFMAVTDHSEWMAEIDTILDSEFDPSDPEAQALLQAHRAGNTVEGGGYPATMGVLTHGMISPAPVHESYVDDTSEDFKRRMRSMWAYMAETANKHYEPGTFTTFVGYEWSATPNGANLHRCVIFKGDDVPEMPLSYVDTQNPEDLWQWMEEVGGAPENVLAIPHNANTSQGLMFLPQYHDGRPIDVAYAEKRSMMEPLTEIHQIKGNSETSPALAMNDEFADFEQIVGGSEWGAGVASPYSFVRSGLKEGLRQADNLGVNPFKYGIIGSTDTHTGTPGDTEEHDWSGHFPHLDTSPEKRLEGGSEEIISALEENPGGLAGVWAEENTRDAIFGGLRRRETFGTSGVRIRPRFFGGWNLTGEVTPDFVELGYRHGVPMGSDLLERAADTPTFHVSALKDPISANLDRIQIVKGWADRGQVFEEIYDVAWAGDRRPNQGDGKLPAVGNTVNVAEASYTNDIGSPELAASWTDPNFDPGIRAFYYARVIEIPTPRWSTYDANRLGVAAPQPATIQERAWTSPIWYVPNDADSSAAEGANADTVRVTDLAARSIEALSQQEVNDLVVGNTLRVVNTVTSEEGLVSFLEDGVQTITLPPHRVIRQDYEIGTDGRLNQHSIRGLPVSFQLFEVDGRYLAARNDETGYCNYEISVVAG